MKKTFLVTQPVSLWRALCASVARSESILLFAAALLNTLLILGFEAWDGSHVGADKIVVSLGGGRSVAAVAVLGGFVLLGARMQLLRQKQLSLSSRGIEYAVDVDDDGVTTRYAGCSVRYPWSALQRSFVRKDHLALQFGSGVVHLPQGVLSDTDRSELGAFLKQIPPTILEK